MQAILVKFIYLVLIVYAVMASFISIRDIVTTKHKTLFISLIGVIIGLITLFLFSRHFSALAIPLALLISVPIFATDKRRNWDVVDRIFRWVSLLAIGCAIYLFLNYYFLR